jgi:long-chain acyl-CoA synthetase
MPERIWLEKYPDYVPKHIDLSKYGNVMDIIDSAVSRFADKEAFKNMDVSFSYRDIDEASDAFAWYIQNETKLVPGDRIAIQMPNLLQFPVVLFGAVKAGLIVVNTNPLYTPGEMKHQFNDAGVKAIVILENFASNLEQIVSETKIETVIVTRIGDLLGGLKGGIVNFVVKNIKKMVPKYSIPSKVMFKNVMGLGKGKKPERHVAKQDDTLFLQYTGGTTGVSKGAELTHKNIIANVLQVNAWIGAKFRDGEEVIITALPLYHIFALTVNLFVFFGIGARNVLITNPRDMPKFMKDLIKNPFSYFTGVNTLFNGMMNQPQFSEIDFSNAQITIGGGMALQDFVVKEWERKAGHVLLEGYGLSETSPVACVDPTDGSHRIGTIGFPVPDTDFILLDDDLNEVGVGEDGEIAIKGPQVMKKYWNRPEETKKSFFGEYFLTGDIGVMSEDGYFKIVDRKKEMINVSGFNVYPSEVEAVISDHPKVLEVGVKGVPDEKSTEVVMAFIVKKDNSLTREEIVEFCSDKLTKYKIPKHIVFREELPKSNVGKILRRLME